MEVSELRCSCKFGRNEQLGKGPKLSAQHHPLEPLAAACPAGIGLKVNPGKLWFLRQVCPLRRISPPEMYWTAEETPGNSWDTGENIEVLNNPPLPQWPTFNISPNVSAVSFLSVQNNNWEKLPARSEGVNELSIRILNFAWADRKQRACPTAGRHGRTRTCPLGATQRPESIASSFSLPCSQGKRPWISSLTWLRGSRGLRRPGACGRAPDLPWRGPSTRARRDLARGQRFLPSTCIVRVLEPAHPSHGPGGNRLRV